MVRLISANRLADGTVVYLGAGGAWVEAFADAAAFENEAAFEEGLARAKADERANLVVEVAPVEAVRSAGVVKPGHIREAIRAAGPTIHKDLGKQAAGARPPRA